MHFTETDLNLFRHIAEAGSITHGAARAHLALTAASMRVRNMETQLGVMLLERRRHGVVLTPAGRVLLEHARSLMSQADRLREDLSLFQGGLAGQVRVLTNTNAYTSFLPDALGTFLTKYPNIDVHIAERTSQAIIGLVADGTAEIGIVADETDIGGLVARPFATDRYALVVPPGHALCGAAEIAFERTLDLAFVAGPSHSLLVSKAQRLGKVLKTRVKMRDYAQVCKLVSDGVGVGIVPLSVATAVAKVWSTGVVRLADGWAVRRMFACVREVDQLARSAGLLFDHLTTLPDSQRADAEPAVGADA